MLFHAHAAALAAYHFITLLRVGDMSVGCYAIRHTLLLLLPALHESDTLMR